MDDKPVRYYPNEPDVINNDPQEEIIEVDTPVVAQVIENIEPIGDPDNVLKKQDG